MQWKLDSGSPIYQQLVDVLKRRIIAGVYPAGERMPPVRELAMEAGVNPNTMQRALQELERELLVFPHRTSGRFVTEDQATIDAAKEHLAQTHIRAFFENMHSLGYERDEIIKLLQQERGEES